MNQTHIDPEAGQSTAEYAIVLLLIAIAVVGSLSSIGPFVAGIFTSVTGGI